MMPRTWATLLLVTLGASVASAQDPAPAPAAPTGPLDIRQVQIQVWISETGEQGLRDLGANLTYKRFVKGAEQSGSVQQINTQVHDLEDPEFTVTLPVPDQSDFNTPLRPDQSGGLTDGIQTQQGIGGTFNVIFNDYGTVNGAFRAVERKSDVDLISKPEILVINGQPAEIHAGGEVPYQSVKYQKGQPQLNVTWEQIGVNMVLTPHIQPDDMIQLDITTLDITDVARIDTIRGIDFPVFSTRKQAGSVLVPNSQTLVVGGLSSRIVRRDERRVPVVGKVPLLGIPFRGRQSDASTNHLLIFVSPTIVDLQALDESGVDALDFWQKEQWRHSRDIGQEMELLESDL